MLTVNVGEAKKKFLDLVRHVEKHQSIVINKKGEPVAALLPYSEYVSLNRLRSYIAFKELSKVLKGSETNAQELSSSSRAELEGRGE